MKERNPPFRLLRCLMIFVGTFSAFAALSTVSVAQERPVSHADYLYAVGLQEEAALLELRLREDLARQRSDMPVFQREQSAGFFAFVLAVSEITENIADVLEEEGVDLINAITADVRPFGEQSLLADLVIVGDVQAVERTGEPADGFESSAIVSVQSLLKGVTQAHPVVIRQRDRPARNEGDIRPETGRRYLFLLSSGMYQYQAVNNIARQTGASEIEIPEGAYVIYRIDPMVDGRLDWGGYGSRETEDAFEDIRRVERILQSHRVAD